MSVEDDTAEVYDILSEQYSEEEGEWIREKHDDLRFLEEQRRRSLSQPPFRSISYDQPPSDFISPHSIQPSRKNSLHDEPYQNNNQEIPNLLKMVQDLLNERFVSQNEKEALQARVKDVTSQLEKQLIRREADQKKIVGLRMELQRAKPPPPPTPPPPPSPGLTSPLNCDVRLVDINTAAENDFTWPAQHQDAIHQLTKGEAGNPPTGNLLGLWDPEVQIVSIGFDLPEWVNIRLSNTENEGPLGKTGYLIHLRVLEQITKNLKDLTSSLSVLETAFENNEALFQEEKKQRVAAETQVEELLNKLKWMEDQERIRVETRRLGWLEDLKKAELELEEARKDGEYYDPFDPDQTKAHARIQQQLQEIERLNNALQDLDGGRVRL